MKPKITKTYSINNDKCFGFKFEKSEFVKYLSTTIKKKYDDTNRSETISEYIEKSSILKKTKLKNILTKNKPPKYSLWKAGEIISQCYLEDYQNVIIPYDKRWGDINQNASPAGIDLIGLIGENTPLLLFVEIKTTIQKTSPPTIMSKLYKQIKDLSGTDLRNGIIQYLILNIKDRKKQLRTKIDTAICMHYEDKFNVFGILVKEENPNTKDLKKLFETLKPFFQDENCLELHAIYLPIPPSDIKGHLID